MNKTTDIKEIRNYFDVACEVFCMTPDELKKYINISHHDADMMARDAWIRLNPRTEEEIIRYYTEDRSFSLFHIRLSWSANKDTCDPTLFGILQKYISNVKNCKILDYGCGSGLCGLSLFNCGCQNVFFADVPTPLFEIVRHTLSSHIGNDKFLTIQEKYPLKDNYDLIICADVFEHVKDPDILLRHLTDHINSNGYLYMTAFFGASDLAPCHLRENCEKYNPELWKDIIKTCRLEAVYIQEHAVYDGLYKKI